MQIQIPFNKPYLTGKEAHYMYEAVYKNGHISGNGEFTKRVHRLFEERYGLKKCLLTTSCTDALEMTALLLNIQPGDEVIVPAYTFVSTALAFVRQGATIKFVDSRHDHPGMDENLIENAISSKTKAIVVVHYAGIACDMDKIMSLAKRYNLHVIEDAAQAIDSYYKGKPLGSIGDLGCFSFHETKNLQCGEGGMLVINNEDFIERAEIIWEKGTNRAKFFRGEIDKYGWVDIGSSFLPSDILAAFLYAQLEYINEIQNKRKKIWYKYHESLQPLLSKTIQLPVNLDYSTQNAHMYYLVCNNLEERTKLIAFLKENKIMSVFHYLSLNKSRFYQSKLLEKKDYHFSDIYMDRLLRLPFYFELNIQQVEYIIKSVMKFYD